MPDLKKYKMFINGEWVDSESKKTFKSLNPENNEPWAEVPEASEKDVDKAVKAAQEAFSGNILGSNIPKVNIQPNKIEEKINIVDLVLLSKLENSKSEIRRLIKGNAVKINEDVISDEKFEIKKNLFKDNYLKLSLGKKRHIKIELN